MASFAMINSSRNSLEKTTSNASVAYGGNLTQRPFQGAQNPNQTFQVNMSNFSSIEKIDPIASDRKQKRGRHTFAHEFYSPPKNEKNLVAPKAHKVPKQKRPAFTDEESKAKNWVPSAYYKTVTEWNTRIPKNTGKFKRAPRRTVADEIIHNSKFPEKTSPGANAYNQEAWKKSTHG